MATDAGDIDLRRDLLEHLAQAEHAHWMNARTSCVYIAGKYDIDTNAVFTEHVQDLINLGLVEEDHSGHRVTEKGRERLGGVYLNPLTRPDYGD
jgi:predicted transcriptional regulator